MKEDVFLKVGYTTYLQKSKSKDKKKNWTSKIIESIIAHKLLAIILAVIIMCVVMNFWLIYKFINILEMSKMF